MRANYVLVLIMLSMLAIAGCKVASPNVNETNGTVVPGENVTSPNSTEETKEVPVEASSSITIEAVEGDLVQLKPVAVDPDNDVITYRFTKPFNDNGKWQTKEGDAGKYLVSVTASDGKANTTQDVLVIIHKANKAPVIECPPELTAKEGDLIEIKCNIYDPEGESVVVEYSGFMKSSTYLTNFNDAGEYTVVVKAKDSNGKAAEKTIKVKIADVNRAPEIKNIPETINAMEGEVITLTPEAVDPDGNKVTVTFSEPFDSKGTWKTKVGDAGTIKASVIASDGKATIKKDFNVAISMKNTAPVIKNINDITVYEGDTIKLPIEVTDREGDKVKVTVSGWMNSAEYTTTYDDAGEYTVTVAAADGAYEAKQTFKVTVLDKNRPPVFKIPA
ncbi:MAG: Ig-like domain-containing protein [archaeon]